jgi:hypothetical protein
MKMSKAQYHIFPSQVNLGKIFLGNRLCFMFGIHVYYPNDGYDTGKIVVQILNEL